MIGDNSPLISADMLPVIAPEQMRAARGFLDWSRKQLGLVSGVSAETIKNIEHGAYSPQDATSKGILRAFSSHGVEFFNIGRLNAFGVIMVITKDEKPSLTEGLSS